MATVASDPGHIDFLRRLDFLSKLVAEREPTPDRRAPRRGEPGPESDGKVTYAQRQTINRQAQRKHREWKGLYIRALEQEVLRLKEEFFTVIRERDQIREENCHLKELLASQNISHDFKSGTSKLKREGSDRGHFDHGSSASGSILGSYAGTSEQATYEPSFYKSARSNPFVDRSYVGLADDDGGKLREVFGRAQGPADDGDDTELLILNFLHVMRQAPAAVYDASMYQQPEDDTRPGTREALMVTEPLTTGEIVKLFAESDLKQASPVTQPGDSTSISDSVREALQTFSALLRQAPGGDLNAALIDEQGRFKLWAANIAAHRPKTSRRSLEYRLRDSSELSRTVISLLSDLLVALRELQFSLPGENRTDPGEEQTLNTTMFESSDDALDEIHEVNSCLLRFTMTLQNPARSDQIKQSHMGSDMTRHYQPFFLAHVRNKFPLVADFLAYRISMVIARHKSYFKYREEHHDKLKEGLDDEDDRTNRPSTVATSVEYIAHEPKSINTNAGLDDSLSEYTATSYALSRSEDAPLQPPVLPEAGFDGQVFECPICYGLISVQNHHEWLQHIYDDIPPYICTSQECNVADRPFSHRRDWIRHQKEHSRTWLCPYGCPGIFRSLEAFDDHLKGSHTQDVGPGILRSLAAANSSSSGDAFLDHCPLCLVDLSSSSEKSAQKHVTRHFTQLALFALPGDLFAPRDGDTSDNSDPTAVAAITSKEHLETPITNLEATYLNLPTQAENSHWSSVPNEAVESQARIVEATRLVASVDRYDPEQRPTRNEQVAHLQEETAEETGSICVVGQPDMPEPATRPRSSKLKFTAADDALLIDLKEQKNLTWKQITDFFPGRSSGTLQVRYCTKLRSKTRVSDTWPDDPLSEDNAASHAAS